MKPDTYIMAPYPISTVTSLIPLISLCFYSVSQRIFARQRLVRHVLVATNTRNNRRNVGGIVLCMVRALSKESLWVSVCILLFLLGNVSVNTFPQQRKAFGDVVFYAVRVVSKKNKSLVLPRTYCFLVVNLTTLPRTQTTAYCVE
jgi:hypothetical protein